MSLCNSQLLVDEASCLPRKAPVPSFCSVALIGGERDPRVLAELARGRMRNKIPDLTMACEGRFGDHHALLARMHTDQIDHLATMIEVLDHRIEEVIDPFAEPIEIEEAEGDVVGLGFGDGRLANAGGDRLHGGIIGSNS